MAILAMPGHGQDARGTPRVCRREANVAHADRLRAKLWSARSLLPLFRPVSLLAGTCL